MFRCRTVNKHGTIFDLSVVILEFCACEFTLCVLHLNCLSVCSLSAVNLCSVIEEAAALRVVYSETQWNPRLLLLKQQVSTLEYWMYLFVTLCFDMFFSFFLICFVFVSKITCNVFFVVVVVCFCFCFLLNV